MRCAVMPKVRPRWGQPRDRDTRGVNDAPRAWTTVRSTQAKSSTVEAAHLKWGGVISLADLQSLRRRSPPSGLPTFASAQDGTAAGVEAS
eukprot:4877854-Prymnesium_polylepis.1